MDQTFIRKENPEIIILIGPKGAGKSYIGRLIEKKYGFLFLHVEKIFLEAKKRDLPSEEYAATGYYLVQEELEAILQKKQHVVFETTGIADEFLELLTYLKKKYTVFLIKVHVSSQVALERVYSRDQTYQIQLDRDVIAKINEQSLQTKLDYDLIIENEHTTDAQLMHQLNNIWHSSR